MQAGRFTSVDPLGKLGAAPFSGYLNYPASMNPYQYAYNNPLKYVDPSGESVIGVLQWAQVGMDLYSMVSQYADRNCTTVEQLTRNVLAGAASIAVGFTVGVIIGTAGVLALGPGLLAAVFVGAVGSVVAGQWARAVSNLILGKPWDEGLMKREDILTDFAFGIIGEVIGFGFAKLAKSLLAAKAMKAAAGSIDEVSSGIRLREGNPIAPMEKTLEMALNPELYAYEVAKKYGINLKGSGKPIKITYDPNLKSIGKVVKDSPDIILLGDAAFASEEELAITIAHELNHARSWLQGENASEKAAQAIEEFIRDYIRGVR